MEQKGSERANRRAVLFHWALQHGEWLRISIILLQADPMKGLDHLSWAACCFVIFGLLLQKSFLLLPGLLLLLLLVWLSF